jgi:hypothetical protein
MPCPSHAPWLESLLGLLNSYSCMAINEYLSKNFYIFAHFNNGPLFYF